jgi:3-hydroxybutyryl-CoA dehydrogenase
MRSMALHGISSAAVLGTGMMGPGIAAVLAAGGLESTIVSRSVAGAAKGLDQARKHIRVLLDNELISSDVARQATEHLTTSTDRDEAAARVDLFIESGPEDLAWKQTLFASLDAVSRPGTILASNTSGLSLTAIAERTAHPERVLTTHFWNPPHLIPLVEIVKGAKTESAVANTIRTLLEHCGKTPVVIHKDRPGQLGNRLQMALLREAAYIVGEGIASAEDVDLVLKRAIGLRYPAYGLLEHLDIVGLDLVSAVCAYVGRDLYAEPTPPPYLEALIKDGKTGAQAGQGFLPWTEGKADAAKARRDSFLLNFLRSERKGG